jgi:signal transduction histidine kinase/CHASE2 domain-containing sensor protein
MAAPTDKPRRSPLTSRPVWVIAIVVISAAVGILVDARVPDLKLQVRDWLMRTRGPIAAQDDIAIVAIDERSIARLGRFPWARAEMARALDIISQGQPKVIALDILFSEPTAAADDELLRAAIARAGNVVTAAQLSYSNEDSRRADWLEPLPAILKASAGVGHSNVSTDSDGVARELLLNEVDDRGMVLRALAVEAVRVGDGVAPDQVRQVPFGTIVGDRLIRTQPTAKAAMGVRSGGAPATEVRADQMIIDYLGSTESFAKFTYSFADVVDGRVPQEKLRAKIVLIGATASSLGDHVASPFTHFESDDGNQNGILMPGVEVLANAVDTILRARFYRDTPESLALVCSALVALLIVGLLTIAQGSFESIKQVGALIVFLVVLLLSSYVSFKYLLIVPPLVPMLVSFIVATPLTFARRTLTASMNLDLSIAELSREGQEFGLSPRGLFVPDFYPAPAALIAELAGASSVAILAKLNNTDGTTLYRIVAQRGLPLTFAEGEWIPRKIAVAVASQSSSAEGTVREEPASKYFQIQGDAGEGSAMRALALRLGHNEDDRSADTLFLAYPGGKPPAVESLPLCVEIASDYIAIINGGQFQLPMEVSGAETNRPARGWRLPHGIEWKSRALATLQERLMQWLRFVDRALRSVEDGLIVAGIDGNILFANPSAAQVFGVPENALRGSNLFARLNNSVKGFDKRETLARLLVDRTPVESELTIGDSPERRYTIRLSHVSDGLDASGRAFGLVASFSDVTKQYQLRQLKNDVVTLVTHELRTPLTAIQGFSELLETFVVEPDKQRKMHVAINEEAKRLSRLIDDYLDITRLESGARPLQLTSVNINDLIERTVLLLDPLAARRGIRLVRRFVDDLPRMQVDSNLIARAVTNLIANAIKFSPDGSQVFVAARTARGTLTIEVSDEGPGIPREELARIFEKFYRVLSVEKDGPPGTGLGLALVREIAELHHGRASATSIHGKGSTFTLCLPLSETA